MSRRDLSLAVRLIVAVIPVGVLVLRSMLCTVAWVSDDCNALDQFAWYWLVESAGWVLSLAAPLAWPGLFEGRAPLRVVAGALLLLLALPRATRPPWPFVVFASWCWWLSLGSLGDAWGALAGLGLLSQWLQG